MKSNLNPHGVSAIVQRGTNVEVRYGDGKETVIVSNTTTSKVMKDIQAMKSRADSEGDGGPSTSR